ncbi:MAG: Ig-like domain-containing domain [Phycisphaerales bacterium]
MPGIRIDGCEWGAGGQLQGNADGPYIVNSVLRADIQMWKAVRMAMRMHFYMCSQISTGLAFVNVAGGSSQVSSWDPQLVDAEVAGNLFAADSWEWLWNNRDPDNPTLKRGNRGFRYNAATAMAIRDADIDNEIGGGSFDIDDIADADAGTGNVETTIEVADLTAAGDWLMPSGDWSAINVVPPHEVPGAYWDFRGLLRDESAATWLMGAVGATPLLDSSTPADSATGVSKATGVTGQASEDVVAGSGTAYIKRWDDDTTVASVAAGSLTINSGTEIAYFAGGTYSGEADGTRLYLEAPSGFVVSDATGLPMAAIAKGDLDWTLESTSSGNTSTTRVAGGAVSARRVAKQRVSQGRAAR